MTFPSPLTVLRYAGLGLTVVGGLLWVPGQGDAESWKALVMAWGLGLWAMTLAAPTAISLPVVLAGAFLSLQFLGRGGHPQSHGTACLVVACALAFYLGWARAAWPRPLALATIWICIARASADLLALAPWTFNPDAVTSFFQNRHAFAGFLLAAVFAHFLWLERATQSGQRMPLGLWTSSLGVLIALLLSDSRSAQGVFFLLFFPLVFLSLRLDFREPHPERLVWVAGVTLCAGMVWLHLPDRQLHAAARAFTEQPMQIVQEREAAWQGFLQSPWLGHGSGSYPWAVPSGPAWQRQEAALDRAQNQADLALIAEARPTAYSHPLHTLTENGWVGLALEGAVLALALAALFRNALKEGHPHTRFAGLALLALYLHGLFTPALESTPLRVLFYALLGFGASQASGYALAKIKLGWEWGWVARTAVILLLAYGLSLHLRQWRADWLFRQALLSLDNPKAFTDHLVAALHLHPRHVEANYAYAQVLARFQRRVEAMLRIDMLAAFAPDPPRQDMARASILAATQAPDEALALLRPWLRRNHPPLPALEMAVDLAIESGKCDDLGELQGDSSRFLAEYPVPKAENYTIKALQQEFLVGEEVNFLQRWFGGKSLRSRFMERRLQTYHFESDTRKRLEKSLRRPCDDKSGPASGNRFRHRLPQG